MPIRVLIADDHAVFRSGLKSLLEKEEDIEVVGETGDGFATIEAATNQEIDILLLDISMP
ncbi:MAG: response regulator transcription factor, partial [Pirellulales bacterium]